MDIATEDGPMDFFFYDAESPQGRALKTYPWLVNQGYTTPPTTTVYRVIQEKLCGTLTWDLKVTSQVLNQLGCTLLGKIEGDYNTLFVTQT